MEIDVSHFDEDDDDLDVKTNSSVTRDDDITMEEFSNIE